MANIVVQLNGADGTKIKTIANYYSVDYAHKENDYAPLELVFPNEGEFRWNDFYKNMMMLPIRSYPGLLPKRDQDQTIKSQKNNRLSFLKIK